MGMVSVFFADGLSSLPLAGWKTTRLAPPSFLTTETAGLATGAAGSFFVGGNRVGPAVAETVWMGPGWAARFAPLAGLCSGGGTGVGPACAETVGVGPAWAAAFAPWPGRHATSWATRSGVCRVIDTVGPLTNAPTCFSTALFAGATVSPPTLHEP